MTLQQYYKDQIYSYGYLDATRGKDTTAHLNDIHYQDELDVCIVLDYQGSYEVSEGDKKFIEALLGITYDELMEM